MVGSMPSMLQASFDLIICMPPWETPSPKCTEEMRECSRAEISHRYGSELMSGGDDGVLVPVFPLTRAVPAGFTFYSTED